MEAHVCTHDAWSLASRNPVRHTMVVEGPLSWPSAACSRPCWRRSRRGSTSPAIWAARPSAQSTPRPSSTTCERAARAYPIPYTLPRRRHRASLRAPGVLDTHGAAGRRWRARRPALAARSCGGRRARCGWVINRASRTRVWQDSHLHSCRRDYWALRRIGDGTHRQCASRSAAARRAAALAGTPFGVN